LKKEDYNFLPNNKENAVENIRIGELVKIIIEEINREIEEAIKGINNQENMSATQASRKAREDINRPY